MRSRWRGFTIVELLVVITIIAVLASLVTVTYRGAQARARDAARISKVNDIAKALDIYKIKNNRYPAIQDGIGTETGCGSQTENWGHCDRMKTLADELAPYIDLEPESLTTATQGNYYYEYTSDLPVDSGKSYGLMVYLEGDGGANDGGFFANAYEVGQNPSYCMRTYTGNNARWTWSWDGVVWGNTQKCYGGN